MGSRKRPHYEAIESGHLQELLAESLAYVQLVVTNSFLVIILNNCLLPIVGEVYKGASQRIISTCVMYYSKFEQDSSAFIKVLTEWSLMRTSKQRKKPAGNSQKWSQSLTGVVAYESFLLQSLSNKSNGVSQCWS